MKTMEERKSSHLLCGKGIGFDGICVKVSTTPINVQEIKQLIFFVKTRQCGRNIQYWLEMGKKELSEYEIKK